MTTIRKGYVDTSDGQVHYQTVDGGSGDPIVMIHMTASYGASYDALMLELAGKYTTIACDTPNYGNSFRTDKAPTIEYIASVWLEALDGLGVEGFHVLGHHTGASIAVEMAVQAPERVRSVTLSGLVYATEEEMAGYTAGFVTPNPITDYGAQFIGAWTRVITTMDGFDLPAEFKHREALGTLLAGEDWAWAYRAVFAYAPMEKVPLVQCPIFSVTGELDRYTNPLHHRLVADHPDIKVLSPEGRGVDYLDTYAAEFAPYLVEFVEGASDNG